MGPLKHKNDDCYFFMYSQCTKGSSCQYRHCLAAKATTVVCRYWINGCCLKRDCAFRHIRGNVTYRKSDYEKFNEEKLYPIYDVKKLDKHVILPVSSTPSPISVKKAIKAAVFSPAPENFLNHMVIPYPIEPVVISFDDEESDSESACSTPIKSTNDTECDSSTVKKNLLSELADNTLDRSEIKSDLKETEETRLEKILEESYQFYKLGYDSLTVEQDYFKMKPGRSYKFERCTDPLSLKVKTIEEIRKEKTEKSEKRKEIEVPCPDKNVKRMKFESSPTNLCNYLPAKDIKSNSAKEKQIVTASHPVFQSTCFSSSVSPASGTKLLELVEMEKVEHNSGKSSGNSHQKSARPAVYDLNSSILNVEETLLDYEPDDVLP